VESVRACPRGDVSPCHHLSSAPGSSPNQLRSSQPPSAAGPWLSEGEGSLPRAEAVLGLGEAEELSQPLRARWQQRSGLGFSAAGAPPWHDLPGSCLVLLGHNSPVQA